MKKHHTIFGDYLTDVEDLGPEERQALIQEVEAHNREVTPPRKRSKGTIDLAISVPWFAAASVSFFSGNLLFFSLGLLGGIFFLIRGLTKRLTGVKEI